MASCIAVDFVAHCWLVLSPEKADAVLCSALSCTARHCSRQVGDAQKVACDEGERILPENMLLS